MESNSRLKVLISAYACSPFRGSEPGVGWGFVQALAAHHDLWVIVEEEKFRADLERYMVDHPELATRVRFAYVRKRRNRWLRKLWPPSYYWYYGEWQEEALKLARRLHSEVGFDLAHQLTMVGFREPGRLWDLGIPFVWGPVGGMGTFPWRFLGQVGWRGALYYLAYNAINLAQARWMLAPRLAARAAGKGLILATHENLTGARRYWGCDGSVMCEVGLPRAPAVLPPHRGPNAPLSLVWSGQHTPRKALNLALAALARVARECWTLDVLGEGPETDRWLRAAERLGIADRCHFHGWIERSRALEIMQSAHAMLITSLRDLTSTVTVEALALGLPVICPDHCGFSEVIDDSCGIRISVRTPPQFVADMAHAVESLARDEALRQRLAAGALGRAPAFTWSAKAARIDEIYRSVLAAQHVDTDRPNWLAGSTR